MDMYDSALHVYRQLQLKAGTLSVLYTRKGNKGKQLAHNCYKVISIVQHLWAFET